MPVPDHLYLKMYPGYRPVPGSEWLRCSKGFFRKSGLSRIYMSKNSYTNTFFQFLFLQSARLNRTVTSLMPLSLIIAKFPAACNVKKPPVRKAFLFHSMPFPMKQKNTSGFPEVNLKPMFSYYQHSKCTDALNNYHRHAYYNHSGFVQAVLPFSSTHSIRI